jgi:hypothetical protein
VHVIHAVNVAEALPLGVDYLLQHGSQEASRNGPVLVAPGPVATVYARPRECVLFNAVRDANPAFHLIEAAAMLAGRSDAALLNNYISDFGARFAEPDGNIHGGYGQRWRTHFGYDQLAVCIEKLRRNRGDRQAVIQMWDASDIAAADVYDRYTIGANDLKGEWRDRPCNLMINLRVRDDALHMMTTSRSHDFLFGLAGANSVHFAILLEYLAAMIGVQVGTLTMVSWNLHIYVIELERLARRAGAPKGTPVSALRALGLPLALAGNGYATAGVAPMALVDEPESFDRELMRLMEMLDDLHVIDPEPCAPNWGFRNMFLSRTVWPMAVCMRLWRLGHRNEALALTTEIAATDWRLACREWFERRMRKPEMVAS